MILNDISARRSLVLYNNNNDNKYSIYIEQNIKEMFLCYGLIIYFHP